MDTIILFYKKRDLEKPEISVAEAAEYRLIRVGLYGKEDSWFGEPVVISELEQSYPTGERLGFREFLRQQGIRPWKWPGERRRRRQAAEEHLERLRQQEEKLAWVEGELRSLAEKILARREELDNCACVYMDGVKHVLQGEGVLPQLWQKHWNVPEFKGWGQYRWAKLLLPHVAHNNYVILGKPTCIREVAEACARHMKSLRWILRERDLTEDVQEFIEDFYDEYGLAVILQTVGGRNGFRSLCLEAIQPICVLDFTEEVKFFWGGLPAESVWLDFLSSEEKERRLERLAPEISYYSLKKLWCLFP